MNTEKYFTLSEIKEKMAHYCVYQDRCHWEVERKLREFRLIPEAREEVLLALIQNNFLNEERFTLTYARSKFNQNSWGRNKIFMELKRREITEKLIEKALKEIDNEAYFETLYSLADKKKESLNAEPNSFKKQMKVKTYLIQKGYESDLVYKVVDDLFSK